MWPITQKLESVRKEEERGILITPRKTHTPCLIISWPMKHKVNVKVYVNPASRYQRSEGDEKEKMGYQIECTS